MTERLAYPLDEAAVLAGISVKTLRRDIRDGHVTMRRIRSKPVILAAELARYLESRPVERAAANAGRSGAAVTRLPRTPPARGRVTRLVDITPIVLEDAQ